MAARKYKAGKLFNKILKLIFRNYLKMLFEFSMDLNQLQGIDPPYIVLANHTNFWDPFLLSLCFSEPVYFVTSDAYFRNPVLKRLLSLVGAIPKTKLVSDPTSIRGILEVVKNRGIIGIFPEGRRNWDGKTLPLLHPTAKLIKSLGIPVISAVFKGACLSMPRWSSTTRKGSLVMELSKALEPSEIKSLTVNQLYQRISEKLNYNEYDYQRIHMHRYSGENMAERLELFLFTCPECKSTGSLYSQGDFFCCRSCGYKVLYNCYGFFEPVNKDQTTHFSDPQSWNLWQLDQLSEYIGNRIDSNPQDVIWIEQNINLRTGQKTGVLKGPSEVGALSLYSDRVEYLSKNDGTLRFSLENMSGLNIQLNNQLEFIHHKVLFRFSKKDGSMPAYFFSKAIEAIKKRSERGAT